MQAERRFVLPSPQAVRGQKRYRRIGKALGLGAMKAGYAINDTFRQYRHWRDDSRHAQGLRLGN